MAMTSACLGLLTPTLTALVLLPAVVSGEVPTISGSGVFVVGYEKTLLCYVTSAATSPNGSFPLTWTREKTGDTPLAASSETSQHVSGINVNSYVSYYRFVVEKGNNGETFTCTARFGGTTEATTWKVYVYVPPNAPVITGPHEIVSDIATTWQCHVDGASTSPNLYWQFGNGTRIFTGVTALPPVLYLDPDDVYISSIARLTVYKVGVNLNMTVPPDTPSFDLQCRVVHYETSTQKSANISVTVVTRFVGDV